MRGLSQNAKKKKPNGFVRACAAHGQISVCVLIKGTFKSGPCIGNVVMVLFPA